MISILYNLNSMRNTNVQTIKATILINISKKYAY